MLDEPDIDERDRKAIRELIRRQDARGGLDATTNADNSPTPHAERADTALVDVERGDVANLRGFEPRKS